MLNSREQAHQTNTMVLNVTYDDRDITDITWPLSHADLAVLDEQLSRKCCLSASGHGFLICGSADNLVDIYSLSPYKDANAGVRQERSLRYHRDPVVSVAVNALDTLLVSADSSGKIVFWRR